MTQKVKASVAKPNDLCPYTGTLIMAGKRELTHINCPLTFTYMV